MNDFLRPTADAAGASARPLLTVERAAFLASVSEATIRRAIRDGRLASIRIGRSVRIRPDDLEAFLAPSNGLIG